MSEVQASEPVNSGSTANVVDGNGDPIMTDANVAAGGDATGSQSQIPTAVDPVAEFGLDANVQNMVSAEREALKGGKKDMANVAGLPVRAYLDKTVVPITLDAFAALARERPPNPIEYLAAYLLKHKEKYE
eukprot:Nk52_evm107s226 gene=Nk52_evmTU107s226